MMLSAKCCFPQAVACIIKTLFFLIVAMNTVVIVPEECNKCFDDLATYNQDISNVFVFLFLPVIVSETIFPPVCVSVRQ